MAAERTEATETSRSHHYYFPPADANRAEAVDCRKFACSISLEAVPARLYKSVGGKRMRLKFRRWPLRAMVQVRVP